MTNTNHQDWLAGEKRPPAATTSCRITGLRYLPLAQEFEATVEEVGPDGTVTGKITAASKSLTRLVEIIAPTKAENL